MMTSTQIDQHNHNEQQHPNSQRCTLNDLFNPSVTTLDLCNLHSISLEQLADLLDSENFRRVQVAFSKINNARSSIIEQESKVARDRTTHGSTQRCSDFDRARRNATKSSNQASHQTIYTNLSEFQCAPCSQPGTCYIVHYEYQA